MPESLENNNENLGFTKRQKIMSAFLGIFAVCFFFLWVAQFKKNLSDPLNGKTTNSNNTPIETPSEDDSIAALKAKDTDKDGLSDYDELNIYKTSPYIEDSDSDGIPDGKEIKDNTDPNCPTGRNCFSADTTTATDNSDTQPNSTSTIKTPVTPLPTLDVSGKVSDTDMKNVLGGNTDAASLRKMLLDAGMDPAMLNKITDDELMKSYKDTLGSVKSQ